MKTRQIAALAALLCLCLVASAQSYQIRVTYATNLRAAYSLDAARVETVPPGTTLQVAGSQGRWLRIRRGESEAWMAGWVAHTRVQAQSDSDYCCFLNGRCLGDAHGNRAWAADRQEPCESDPPIVIEGGDGFREQILESLRLLRRENPTWYDYVTSGLVKVAQTDSYADTFVNFHSKVFYFDQDDGWPPGLTRREHAAYIASVLVHEACHVRRYEAGFAYHGWQTREEGACTQAQLEAYEALDPDGPRAAWLRELLANIEDPEYQWWQ